MAVKQFKPGEVDPLSKKTVESLNKKKKVIEEKFDKVQISPEGFDLSDGFTLGGMPARPFSAGIVTILEMIEHPLFADDENEEANENEEIKENDIKLADIMILLFLFLADASEEELVEMAVEGGYKQVKKAALIWSFSVTKPQMEAMTADINNLMGQFNNTMELYSGTPGGEEGKKSVTG